MNLIKRSLKNNKRYFKFTIILLCFGFLIGFVLTKKAEISPILDNISSIESYLNSNNINYLSTHIITLLVLITASLTVLGLVLFPINIIYEGICIAFNIITFSSVFKLSGFIYGLIYNIITKGIYVLVLIFIFKKLTIILKKLMIKSDKENKKALIIKNIKHIGFYIITITTYDIFLYLFGSKLLSYFLFLIK